MRVFFCIDFLVENLNFMTWRETANSLARKSTRSLVNLIVGVDLYLFPVLAEMRIRISTRSKPIKLVEVLENH